MQYESKFAMTESMSVSEIWLESIMNSIEYGNPEIIRENILVVL